MKQPKVIIYGAGSIGCYIGGCLINAGVDCILVAREPTIEAIRQYGLRLTDFEDRDTLLKGPVKMTAGAQGLSEADIILLTVKCKDVEDAVKYMAPEIRNDTIVVCLQNGVGAKNIALKYLPPDNVIPGVLTFNVVNMGSGRFHKGNKGELIFENHPGVDPSFFTRDGLAARSTDNIESVLWGKLILNLNNAINALSGVPLLEELSRHGYRKILSASIRELMTLLKIKGIKPEALAGIPPGLSALMLRLPDRLFKVLAKKRLQIDPLARSSMWEDLQNKKETEIDYLNGAIVRLAEELGRAAPVNSRLIELIKEAESSAAGSPKITAGELNKLIRL